MQEIPLGMRGRAMPERESAAGPLVAVQRLALAESPVAAQSLEAAEPPAQEGLRLTAE